MNPYANRIRQIYLECMEELSSSSFKTLLAKHNGPSSTKVFGHNDFYFLNIIQSSLNPDQMTLIDYEMSCVNVLGWDLAHAVVELTTYYDQKNGSFKEQFEGGFPSHQQIQELIKGYLVLFNSSDAPFELPRGKDFIGRLRKGEFDHLVREEEVSTQTSNLYEICVLLNLFWILWCFTQLAEKEASFPVESYIIARHEAHLKLRSTMEQYSQSYFQ